ncbi:MAG TPA: type II toxin-antitoxin system Phd/YefM family antitoxin [Longimicrobiales bacterium]|nr:type II toxin-antitoxin system Phd/YefM family antitoxin [Longimicrobiales bacterium]
MSQISITHLARNLADLVNRVAYRGERFTVVRGNRPVAELIPAPRGRRLGELPAILADLPGLGPVEAEALGSDLDAARAESGRAERDPWAS